MVSLQGLTAAVLARVPKGTEDLNRRALAAGWLRPRRPGPLRPPENRRNPGEVFLSMDDCYLGRAEADLWGSPSSRPDAALYHFHKIAGWILIPICLAAVFIQFNLSTDNPTS